MNNPDHMKDAVVTVYGVLIYEHDQEDNLRKDVFKVLKIQQ